jgi:hypothetical protein
MTDRRRIAVSALKWLRYKGSLRFPIRANEPSASNRAATAGGYIPHPRLTLTAAPKPSPGAHGGRPPDGSAERTVYQHVLQYISISGGPTAGGAHAGQVYRIQSTNIVAGNFVDAFGGPGQLPPTATLRMAYCGASNTHRSPAGIDHRV